MFSQIIPRSGGMGNGLSFQDDPLKPALLILPQHPVVHNLRSVWLMYGGYWVAEVEPTITNLPLRGCFGQFSDCYVWDKLCKECSGCWFSSSPSTFNNLLCVDHQTNKSFHLLLSFQNSSWIPSRIIFFCMMSFITCSFHHDLGLSLGCFPFHFMFRTILGVLHHS